MNEVASLTWWQTLLGLTAIAAVITVVGNVLTTFLKEVFLIRSFEKWKTRQGQAAIYDRFRFPIGVASNELIACCHDLVTNKFWSSENTAFSLISAELGERPKNSRTREHFYRYRLLSNSYHLCCFLGWLEMYSRDLGLLGARFNSEIREFHKIINLIRDDLSRGDLNNDRENTSDFLIFREEQKTIGRRILVPGDEEDFIDFGTFCQSIENTSDSGGNRQWFVLAVRFFSDMEASNDFRITRMKRLVIHLADMKRLLQGGSINPTIANWANDFRANLTVERPPSETNDKYWD